MYHSSVHGSFKDHHEEEILGNELKSTKRDI